MKDGMMYRWPFGERKRPHVVAECSGIARGLGERETFHFIRIGDDEVYGIQIVDE